MTRRQMLLALETCEAGLDHTLEPLYHCTRGRDRLEDYWALEASEERLWPSLVTAIQRGDNGAALSLAEQINRLDNQQHRPVRLADAAFQAIQACIRPWAAALDRWAKALHLRLTAPRASQALLPLSEES